MLLALRNKEFRIIEVSTPLADLILVDFYLKVYTNVSLFDSLHLSSVSLTNTKIERVMVLGFEQTVGLFWRFDPLYLTMIEFMPRNRVKRQEFPFAAVFL